MELPRTFCWTRFGAEAGQPIEEILKRKECERRSNGGVFLWGVGNNVAPSLPVLLGDVDRPEVLFSPIKSRPQAHDVSPESVAVWTRAVGADGEVYEIPGASMVTSRYSRPKKYHYALVCSSPKPLRRVESSVQVALADLSNAKTGNPVGFSQVTAIVRRKPGFGGDGIEYPVSLACELTAPYVIRLECPIVVAGGGDIAAKAWAARRKTGEFDRPTQLSFAV